MARFEVDSAEILRASGNAKTSAAAIRGEVGAMMGHLATLQDSWRGGASSAFTAVLAEWRATQQQVEQSLESIALCLDAGSREYEDAETSALRMFSR
ncbi:MAG TPA: WXG100 family type VII secretion target [Actinotalea caeni]|uniref:WXG100 family type VII secretion target n=1 Tax=Actinotalea caeni TaxID=1348467 RepID=UPI002B4AD9A4|nr:WXG100 family type VII secretion target [Actinotalea caeni]HLV54947.1 WXG100 family type VII secretion target [Actinotalea caeni]